jgi:hypothetical protein
MVILVIAFRQTGVVMKLLSCPFTLYFALFITSASNIQAQDFSKLYKPGATLYVCLVDGLILNDKAGMGASKIKTVPYGSIVLVQADSKPMVATVTDNIPGHWVKVKSDSAVGYMFDGYLTRWLPVAEREAGKAYLDKISRVKSTDKKSPQLSVRDYQKVMYENGITYENKILDDGSSTTVVIPQNNITLREAWQLGLAMFPNYRNTICKYNPSGIRCSDGSTKVLTVKKDGNNVVIREDEKED